MFRRVLLAWPIRRLDQAFFALALAEALDADIEVSAAIALAARVNPSRRFRHALAEMRRQVQAGCSKVPWAEAIYPTRCHGTLAGSACVNRREGVS